MRIVFNVTSDGFDTTANYAVADCTETFVKMLQAAIAAFRDHPLKALNGNTLHSMRWGCYDLIYFQNVPEPVAEAVNEEGGWCLTPWNPSDTEDITEPEDSVEAVRIEAAELVVTDMSFFFTAYPKYEKYQVQTDSIYFSDFEERIVNGRR